MGEIFVNILAKGFTAQVNGLLLFFIFRMGFYVIGYLGDASSLGIYSTAVLLCDSIWILAGALATVTYSRALTHKTDKTLIGDIMRYIKISTVFGVLSVAVLNSLPLTVYVKVFGSDFSRIKDFILPLSPGIIGASILTILIHYYTARGRYTLCFQILLAAFFTSLVGCALLIPPFGSPAAGFASSAGAMLAALSLLVVFQREHKVRLREFFGFTDLMKRNLR